MISDQPKLYEKMNEENIKQSSEALVLEWLSVDAEMPEFDLTVMVHHPDSDEPVWLGYHDGEDWRDVNGDIIQVSHWADMPEPPDFS